MLCCYGASPTAGGTGVTQYARRLTGDGLERRQQMLDGDWGGVMATLQIDLRDYFAGQALVGLGGALHGVSEVQMQRIAEGCYCIADALLRARPVEAKRQWGDT